MVGRPGAQGPEERTGNQIALDELPSHRGCALRLARILDGCGHVT